MNVVVVVGSISTELVIHVPRLPGPGEAVQGGELESFPGGKGANQAVACARLGLDVALIARVGGDDFGRINLSALNVARVNTAHVIEDPSVTTGVTLVAVDPKGEFGLISAAGANLKVLPEDVTRSNIGRPALVLVVNEIPSDAAVAALRWGRESGAMTVLSSEHREALPSELLKWTDYLVVNRLQASALTGARVTGTQSARRAASLLKKSVTSAVVVTLGSKGSMLDDGSGPRLVPSFNVTALDTRAAGDAFCGAFCAQLANGLELTAALRFASAAAALSVSRAGGQRSLPSRREVEAFLSTRGP